MENKKREFDDKKGLMGISSRLMSIHVAKSHKDDPTLPIAPLCATVILDEEAARFKIAQILPDDISRYFFSSDESKVLLNAILKGVVAMDKNIVAIVVMAEASMLQISEGDSIPSTRKEVRDKLKNSGTDVVILQFSFADGTWEKHVYDIIIADDGNRVVSDLPINILSSEDDVPVLGNDPAMLNPFSD